MDERKRELCQCRLEKAQKQIAQAQYFLNGIEKYVDDKIDQEDSEGS